MILSPRGAFVTCSVLFIAVLSAAEHHVPLLPTDGNSSVTLHGIPFSIAETAKNLVPGTYDVSRKFSAIVVAGMTTDSAEASDRWGMAEPASAYEGRLFIGDRLGRIILRYSDDTMEQIPILFGVNVWAYELFCEPTEAEKKLMPPGALAAGPYREPFASDPDAAAKLSSSLITLEAPGAAKPLRYLLGIRLKDVPLKSIELLNEKLRNAGWQVGAITGITHEGSIPDAMKLVDESYFITQKHRAPADALSRRLYQYQDQLPEKLPAPEARKGFPKLIFHGPPEAAILSNVFSANIADLVDNKIANGSRPASSSPNAPGFGGYFGMGTWRDGVGHYSHHSWSRDSGPALRELIALGKDREARAVGETLLKYLYDGDLRHNRPNWKRVINAHEVGEAKKRARQRAEIDGHAAIMLAMARLADSPAVDAQWIEQNWKALEDAGNWFPWLMDNPDVSAFDGLLYNESESSGGGGRDLFSNSQAALALRAFARLAESTGKTDVAKRWNASATRLTTAIKERLSLPQSASDPLSPRYLDTDVLFDSWAYGWKRMAPLLAAADLHGWAFSPAAEERTRLENTYRELRGPSALPDAGRTLGYGQAYLAQSALLLDQVQDATRAVERAAAFCYHPNHPYIVPEGVIVHPRGHCWFRNGDLGNLMQQAEILKMIRILPGIDDRSPKGLTLIPRLPNDWSGIEASDWPVQFRDGASWKRTHIEMSYHRHSEGYHLRMKAREAIPLAMVRIGPFPAAVPLDAIKQKTKTQWIQRGGQWYAEITPLHAMTRELDWRLP